jgi:DNA helicase HerA-like ATPase
MSKVLGIVSSIPELPNTIYCWVQLVDIDVLRKGAFVVLEDAKRSNVKFIGQVIDIINRSDVLKEFSREEMLRSGRMAEDIIAGSLSRPDYFKCFAKVRLMYKIVGDKNIDPIDTPPTDTSRLIEQASKDLPLILGFSTDIQRSICLGPLYSHPDIQACFDLNRMLQGHISIFGQTGSGKSYAAGVIVEEVTARGVPVLVFDHMGEYISMDRAADGGKGLNLIRLRPGVDITIDFDDLMEAPPILTAIGITDAQLNLLRDAYTEALNHGLKGLKAIDWLLQDIQLNIQLRTRQQQRIVKRLYLIGRSRGYSVATIDGLRWKLESLLSRGIIGGGVDIKNLIKPGNLTVIDLTAVDHSLRSLVVATILNKITKLRKKDIIKPLLVVIEEAHNYIPLDETPSSIMIRDLVRGARHWGISVMIISQRPSGIHRDALNIVNTNIIFRLKGTDLEYIKQFTPFTREELEDIQLLPEGIAYITGPIIRGGHAIKVVIRKRRTVHGGHSVNFIP